MSKIKAIAKSLSKTVSDNSPTILAGAAVTGTGLTAYLAAKAGYRAATVIHAEEQLVGTTDDKWARLREHFRLTWALYIPPAMAGAFTIICVVGGNRISSKRAAAMAGMYNLSVAAFQEYKEKVVEQIGANKERKIRDDVAQDRINEDPPLAKEVIITYNGKVLCHDAWSGRFFMSSMEKIRNAEIKIGNQINHDMYASLNDFYRFLGLPGTSGGEDVGWNGQLVELEFSSVIAPEDSDYPNQPCLSFTFRKDPTHGYHKIW